MQHNENNDISFENQKILDIHMEKEVQKSFIEYAMSVIVSRALPDVRDGMKPVHRRILYAMWEDHLTSNNPFYKSATTVGNVLGRYHPHGDSSVYDAMVRLAQPFSLRYPLVEGHGNFGNVDGDGAAAYRYTEARLSKISNEMMSDIEKNEVDFVPNFDNKRREPSVLPARFPNLLVNGSMGIAVGMATNIPPHNMGEVIDGTIYYMEHPDATLEEVMQFIKGPDFPTYATIYGTAGIVEAYRTGKGHISVRARAEVDEDKNKIIITEIPYEVNKSELVKSIANLVKEKRVDGITDIKDLSGRKGMRIEITYRRDANGHVLLNQLYKYTQLQDTCAVNMIALVNNEPRLLPLLDILRHYIRHQEQVVERRTRFDLEKAEQRAHILEGQMIAIDFIDEVIAMIRASKTVQDAKEALMARFGLTDAQAQAIVEMTLGKLAGLERIKIEEELAQKKALIKDLKEILSDSGKLHDLIKSELLEIKRKYGDERRTEIVAAADEINLEDLIARHTCVITITRSGYIKRQNVQDFSSQHRGGRGVIGMRTKEEDDVEDLHVVDSHSHLLLFTDAGKVYVRRAFQIPEAGKTAKGSNLINLIEMQPDERVTSVISIETFDPDAYLLMITRLGVVKRVNVTDFEYQRRGGKIALNLDPGDALAFARLTHGDDDLIIATHNGQAVRFHESEARVMGRTARGVRGIRLVGDDYVVGAAVVEQDKTLLSVSELGYGKKTPFDAYTSHSRGTKGVTCHGITEKTGALCGIAAVGEEDDVMLVTDSGVIIRTPAKDVRTCGRGSQGVIMMRLDADTKITRFAVVPPTEQEDTDIENDDQANTEATASGENVQTGTDVTNNAAPTEEEIAVEEDITPDESVSLP